MNTLYRYTLAIITLALTGCASAQQLYVEPYRLDPGESELREIEISHASAAIINIQPESGDPRVVATLVKVEQPDWSQPPGIQCPPLGVEPCVNPTVTAQVLLRNVSDSQVVNQARLLVTSSFPTDPVNPPPSPDAPTFAGLLVEWAINDPCVTGSPPQSFDPIYAESLGFQAGETAGELTLASKLRYDPVTGTVTGFLVGDLVPTCAITKRFDVKLGK